MKTTRYETPPAPPARPGSNDAMKVPSLENGVRKSYRPPIAMCVGKKTFNGSEK